MKKVAGSVLVPDTRKNLHPTRVQLWALWVPGEESWGRSESGKECQGGDKNEIQLSPSTLSPSPNVLRRQSSQAANGRKNIYSIPPYKRWASVAELTCHLQGSTPYGIRFSHRTYRPLPTKDVT
jgi:hypothetical protein